MAAMRSGLHGDHAGVTPVVGTLLILGITVLGITAVMFWGAPSIQRIQDQNSQTAMLGEFDNLQEITTVLQVPDASRLPRIVQPAGAFGFEPGNRYMITADHDSDAGETACDLRVTGWEVDGTDSFTVTASGCKNIKNSASKPTCTQAEITGADDACMDVFRVTGANLAEQTITGYSSGTYTVAGADFSTGDWLFRLTDGDSTTPEVYAQAWLLSSDRVAWDLASSVGERGVYLDGGAVFAQQSGTTFLERDPPLHEGVFATDVYALFLRTLDADQYSEVTGQASFQMFLGLTTQSARVAEDDVRTVRYDIFGDLAEPWCQSLLLRNSTLSDSSYELDTGASCADTVPSVKYQRPDAMGDPLPFTFHFIHGEIRTSLFN